jgi:hypothetical protein
VSKVGAIQLKRFKNDASLANDSLFSDFSTLHRLAKTEEAADLSGGLFCIDLPF